MKRILVAYDGSPGAELAVNDLAHGGFGNRAEARILVIADLCQPLPSPDGAKASPEPPAVVAARERAAAVLRQAERTAIQGALLLHQVFPEWDVSNVAKADSPAWGILAEAAAWHADLIVIGSHRHTPLEAFFLGSVSRKVAAEAGCSVRVARPRQKPGNLPPRILVAVDGSPDSIAAAEAAWQRKWPAQTHIELVAVKHRKMAGGTFADDQNAPLRFEDSIQSRLETTRARFAAKDLNAQWQMLEGDAKRILPEYALAWNADCIFVGALEKEHGGLHSPGGLATAVGTRAPCTVEIVRAPAETGG